MIANGAPTPSPIALTPAQQRRANLFRWYSTKAHRIVDAESYLEYRHLLWREVDPAVTALCERPAPRIDARIRDQPLKYTFDAWIRRRNGQELFIEVKPAAKLEPPEGVSLAISAGLTALERFWGGEQIVSVVVGWLNITFSFALVVVLFGTIYKVLPSVRVAWRDVFIGALVTALLFTIGKFVIGAYLGNSGLASTYGAAGSVVLLLVWVYYSAQIFLLGAEFTRSYAYQLGSLSAARRTQAPCEAIAVG